MYRVSRASATNSDVAHLKDVLLSSPYCLGERRIWHERRLGFKVGFESGEERHKVSYHSEGPGNMIFHSSSVALKDDLPAEEFLTTKVQMGVVCGKTIHQVSGIRTDFFQVVDRGLQ